MSSIQDVFLQAQFAEAAYANFINPSTGSIYGTQAGLQGALEASGFSTAQASEFVQHWKVKDQVNNSVLGVVGSGFSATIFENLDNPGQYSLAIRGSQGVNDFLVDYALITNQGVAVSQVVDLYNFWIRAQTPAGASYTPAVLEPAIGTSSNLIFIGGIGYAVKKVDSSQLSDTAMQTGSGVFASTPSSIDVSGHSLGGHLAMAFTRLFPNANAISVNGLGFKLDNSNVTNLFSQLAGSTSFSYSSIQNVYGIAGYEFAAMNNGVLQQPGAYDGIFIESAGLGASLGHSALQMTDSLAVYDLFAKVDPSLNDLIANPNALRTITGILTASSSTAANSLESAVSALGSLLRTQNFVAPTGSAYDTDRNALAVNDETIMQEVA